ncbi:U-box domain-containing protein 35 isoform X2 [Beta vulgaris subsp. vulgaris]|uniref:U-box domain-containing protein 35 isoform X2 n=1 Tax=Beta vulgaris subsp. vulgaris TaxID=3555 RepID=UPI0025472A84|nr:U-box domain-containing protein 35 isoform X2 [Beta vulgaris subsp. vulgaris]
MLGIMYEPKYFNLYMDSADTVYLLAGYLKVILVLMEQKDVGNGKGSSDPRVIAIALNGGAKSKYIVRWIVEKFIPEGKVAFKLLHVFPKITGVPTPMGNLIPLPQVRDDVAVAYKKEIEWQRTEMILPFQKALIQKKVSAELVLIEADDVPNGISREIAKHGIKSLVIGASSNSLFARRVKGQLLSSVISDCAPTFCTVYVVSKGKLEALRPSNTKTNGNAVECDSPATNSTNSSSRYTNSTFESPSSSPPGPVKHPDSLTCVKAGYNNSGTNSAELASFQSINTRNADEACSSTVGTLTSEKSSFKTTNGDNESWITDQVSNGIPSSRCGQASASTSQLASSETEVNINLELEKMRIELRHIRGMYAIAQNETVDATRRLSDLSMLRNEEAMKLKQISEKEKKAQELAKLEKEKFESAKREAEYARGRAHREVMHRREAEQNAARDAKESEKLKNVLGDPVYHYQKFTWEEIVSATSSFSEKLKIGEGSYGSVYKCKLHYSTVAIKVLHSKEGAKNKQFHQELDILSRIRHPHVLLLLGACPEQGCLVYEYMENGSLEDRLLQNNDKPPIPWYERFRIMWEVASALAFLHNNKPKAIIHRDLKPANILLDHNLVSKIGDAGLCTMLNLEPSSLSTLTLYKDTSPVGTLCYIDPEYQRTGLISMKADVYALGMVILQLLTAKPAVGITHVVEDAIKEGRLMKILDRSAGRWPLRETAEIALLGLQCAELRRKDRPDLKSILPALERIKDVAENARDLAAKILIAPPSHFICPILKGVMDDPCVASDGYTYDRKAIEMWLKDNDTSPTTNFPLSSKNLIPNYTLSYAITEWKSKRRIQNGNYS